MYYKSKKVATFCATMYLDKSRIIFFGGAFFYVLHASFNLLLHLNYVILYFIRLPSPCSYLMVTWECALYRMPIVFSNLGFTFFHLVLVVERSCAILYVKTYERLSIKAGCFAVFVMMCLTCSYTSYLYYTEDFTVMKSFCNLNSVYNVRKVQFMNNFLLAVDVLVTLADFYLRRLIYLQHKRKIHNYNLQTAYQIKENLLSIQLIFPLALVHSSIFLGYLVSVSAAKTFYAFSNALQFLEFIEVTTLITEVYVVATLVTFSWLIKRRKHENEQKQLLNMVNMSKSADIYFNQFRVQIE